MAESAALEMLRLESEVASGASFLSKIKRSPSRKQKLQPSPLANSSEDLRAQSGRSHSNSISRRTQPRPNLHRAPTAPAAPVSLRSLQSELGRFDDVLGGNAQAAVLVPPPPEIHQSKSASATPTLAEHPNMVDFQPAIHMVPSQSGNVPNPASVYQHIQDMSNKRIATLDYIRKAHEGRIHWFNTVHFSKPEIAKLPSYTPNRLSRRATNYFILGLSIPGVLDGHPQPHPPAATSTNAGIALDYLKSLNSLLMEFEAFQQIHPPDGSSASSLSRARIPQMFKRAPTIGKPRRPSGAAGTDIGLPMQQQATSPPAETGQHHASTPSIDTTNTGNTFSSTATTLTPSSATSTPAVSFPSSTTFPTSSPFDSHANSTVLPNEGPYAHLVTPPLPFAPDFYCVFATLCDVLIDAYQRLLQIVNAPAVCTVSVGDQFNKADARIRKVMVGGIVREFETAAREGAKRELLGVQRLVLGGLTGA